MGRRADEGLARVWGARLRRQRGSGLSIAEFCRREDVSQASFFHWRRRLGEAHGKGRRSGRSSPRPTFLPVEIAALPPPAQIEIELPGGAVVRLPAGAADDLIASAIAAVAAATRGPQAGGGREDA